ncbi:hypothetical protein BUALT_Bualt18G0057200 [Buddleja alternifolia]|uniref:Uncharacterized protein n=1 Tax=Buddleja alternifolia TaxID=168488 RepID=A0AAV6W4M5_9LAMI|nr:hypothetical protein BUALT_Bualt18G0057200 [Buddleja alternifolia]
MVPMKNRRKSNVFGCFKPGGFDDEPRRELKSSRCSGDESGGRRKKSAGRSISGAVKAVFFMKTSLAKKFQTETPKKIVQRSNSNLSSSCKMDKPIKSMKKNLSFTEPILISRTTSEASSSLLSSSSSNSSLVDASSTSSSFGSSTSFNSLSGSSVTIKRSVSFDHFKGTNPINRQKSIKRNMDGSKCTKYIRNPTVEMCVFLVCLVSLVFWGKFFAIVTSTSTWLFFAPSAAAGRQRFESFETPDYDVFEWEEYKKRVVMEGLLERNRLRIRTTMSFCERN